MLRLHYVYLQTGKVALLYSLFDEFGYVFWSYIVVLYDISFLISPNIHSSVAY